MALFLSGDWACVLFPRLFDEQPGMLVSWDLRQLSSVLNLKIYHCIEYTNLKLT